MDIVRRHAPRFVRAAGLLMALSLLAGAAAAQPAPRAQAVRLDTATGTIEGSLLLPPSSRRVPVALIVAGSGPTDRDGNLGGAPGRNDSLKLLAEALASAGIASVRYDKRGVAASAAAAPREADLRFEHYVADAAAWLRMLSSDPRFSHVVVIGHSEGALVGLLAAKQAAAAAYVSIAGPADRASVLLRRQLRGKLPPELAATGEEILSTLESGRMWGDIPGSLGALYRPSVQPYLISWFRWTPTAEIADLAMPCLLVQGGTDIQVRPADARALQQAQARCALVLVPGMNHVMKTVPPDPQQQIASYTDPSLPLDAEFVAALRDFLSKHLR